MMKYVIGQPGFAPRLRVEVSPETDLSSTVQANEVALEVSAFSNGKISESGLAFESSGIDYELEAVMVRSMRTAALLASDWTQADYAPLTPEQKAAWAAYRQALRDLPEAQPNKHRDDIVWPVEPTG